MITLMHEDKKVVQEPTPQLVSDQATDQTTCAWGHPSPSHWMVTPWTCQEPTEMSALLGLWFCPCKICPPCLWEMPRSQFVHVSLTWLWTKDANDPDCIVPVRPQSFQPCQRILRSWVDRSSLREFLCSWCPEFPQPCYLLHPKAPQKIPNQNLHPQIVKDVRVSSVARTSPTKRRSLLWLLQWRGIVLLGSFPLPRVIQTDQLLMLAWMGTRFG